MKELELVRSLKTHHIQTEMFREGRKLSFTQQQKKQTMIKLLHTNAFNSMRFNAKSKSSLTQQNTSTHLTLRVTIAR